MGATAKFLFDVDFAASGKPANTISLADHAAKLAEAETLAYRNGFAAAQAEAEAATARRVGEALEAVGATLERLARRLPEVEGRFEAEAVEVAVAVAGKLAPELIAREPFVEIAALATECFRQLVAAPHIVVRVSDVIYEIARERLDDIARRIGFEGRLVVLAEPDIAAGDCRIDWADGGLNRDRAATEAAIAEAVGRYVAVRRASLS
jgi:flagellar assembly protein FliH